MFCAIIIIICTCMTATEERERERVGVCNTQNYVYMCDLVWVVCVETNIRRGGMNDSYNMN